MLPLPAVFILKDFRVHVSTMNSSDMIPYIETTVNESFCRCTILLWKSQTLIYTMTISDLGDALMTFDLKAKDISLKKYMFFKIVLIILKSMGILLFFIGYGISIIFK